jgi:2-polyprenyl-3-methyl-5-hydroxy-6-metoxy-1,4-benzoquinol methylase
LENISNRIYKNSGNSVVLNEIHNFKNTSAKILDIGCGNGDVARNLNNLNYIIDGITISEQEAINSRKVMRKVLIYNLENGLPIDLLDIKYDIIICSHVLEHICYPTNLLRDIKNILSDKGILIVCLPNLLHYKSRLVLLMGNFHSSDLGGIWDSTHFKWYTYNSGRELLEKNHFNMKSMYVTGEMPFGILFKWVPLKIKRRVFSLLIKISKGFFGEQLVYIAKNI